MEPVRCEVQEIKTSQLNDPIPLAQEEIKLPLSDKKLQAFQAKEKFCKDISSKLQQGQLQDKKPILYRRRSLKKVCGGWKTKV